MVMNIEVEVLSTSTIKPSSPTPSHLRFYQLSFIDQLSIHIYNNLVIFFPPKAIDSNQTLDVVEISHKLKTSLSHVLTQYYPLAGRIKDNLFLTCNDEGIPYLEAQVNCKLSDILPNLQPSELPKFVPFELDGRVDLLLGVQLNIFKCGGIAIGFCITHKIGDALSALMFTKCWAAATRGDHDEDIPWPIYESSTLFPPKDMSKIDMPTIDHIPTKNIVSKRFLFESSKIEALRAKYEEKGNNFKKVIRPSRVEALSAFISSRYMAATKEVFGPKKRRYSIAQAFNLRTRIDPPTPENSFGNFSRQFIRCLDSLGGKEESYSYLVREMRHLMKCGNEKEYAKNIQMGIDQCLIFNKEHAEEIAKGELIDLKFTSICRFPLYDHFDFGWGQPMWIGANPLPCKNLIIFVDTKSGDGIEAYIDFEEEDMAKFERDEEFVSFISSTK
ncbi:stemmadenine O-acetyltransferase-like [Humulus lupulus]|uniref:stemmadenine O-acetyltransferase-like n=1 Tax=Humulus lupulus TaxID=3486 RepID=UPI002B40C958|nr:stemmadenine O-acetyltransferase-like [Humulus lupulus]